MKKNKLAKIFWDDAVIYKPSSSSCSNLTAKITSGELIKKTKEYIIIKNPTTSKYNDKEKMYIPETNADRKFLFIPKGMIKKIVLLPSSSK